jgi:hypothetical protein
MSVIINNKVGLINEIKDICKSNKTKTIPLVCNTLCGFSVNCQIVITPSAIRLDIGSKTIHWREHENEEDYLGFDYYFHFPSAMLFSKFSRPGFNEYINNSSPITDTEVENAINKLIQILDNISFDKKSNIFNYGESNRKTSKPIQECSVCYEETCGITDCKHPLCLPCLEQLQMRNDNHFMTNDCPLCRQEITGY